MPFYLLVVAEEQRVTLFVDVIRAKISTQRFHRVGIPFAGVDVPRVTGDEKRQREIADA